MNVLVIYGGDSSERNISLNTGKGVYEALIRKGYKAELFDFSREKTSELIDKIEVADVSYIALHGKDGEDGKLQGLFNLLNKSFVGSGLSASNIAMNKFLTKQIVSQAGIPTANSVKIKNGVNLKEHMEEIIKKFSFPLVVKPNKEGSSFGFSLVKNPLDLDSAINNALEYDEEVIVEDYIKGREFTVSLIEKNNEVITLPVIEIKPKNEFYDYESKYTEGGSEYICPAKIDSSLEEKLKDYAKKTYTLIGCEDYSRVDFIVEEETGNAFLLELNTLPGMTPTSLLPKAAEVFGYNYDNLVEHLINSAINN